MKHIKSTLIATLLTTSLTLFAEDTFLEELSPPLFMEGSEVASLEDELTILDEEFDAFKNELFSLDEIAENDAAEQVLNSPVVIEDDNLLEEAPLLTEQENVAPPLVAIETTPVENPEIADASVDHTSVDAIEQQAKVQQETAALTEAFALHEETPGILNVEGPALIGEITPKDDSISIDLGSAFAGSPIIYTLLFSMSVAALAIWLYCLKRLKSMTHISEALRRNLSDKLNSNHFDEALSLCNVHANLFSKMVASGIHARRHGLPIMIESMKAEGKRASVDFWQKLGMLNDIAILAPMLGLLGTVMGMFYAFYNINRSIESISTLFDGLGVSVGTTVGGLVVAILALMLHSIAKYRLVKSLATVENEAQNIAIILDDRTSIHNKG